LRYKKNTEDKPELNSIHTYWGRAVVLKKALVAFALAYALNFLLFLLTGLVQECDAHQIRYVSAHCSLAYQAGRAFTPVSFGAIFSPFMAVLFPFSLVTLPLHISHLLWIFVAGVSLYIIALGCGVLGVRYIRKNIAYLYLTIAFSIFMFLAAVMASE